MKCLQDPRPKAELAQSLTLRLFLLDSSEKISQAFLFLGSELEVLLIAVEGWKDGNSIIHTHIPSRVMCSNLY